MKTRIAASDTNRSGNSNNDGWKVLTLDNGVEISKRRSGPLCTLSLHNSSSLWLMQLMLQRSSIGGKVEHP
ncbi:START domain-containing protein [Trifolium repens]|nr:START domain-containing protein [Trifolium repens]